MTTPDPATVGEAPDLFHGGLLYRLMTKHGVDPLDARRTAKRAVLAALLAWLPLLALSFLEPGSQPQITFLKDVAAHIRALVVLPALIAAQPIVAASWRLVGRRMVERGIVPPEARPRYQQLVARTVRLHDHLFPEALCALVAAGLVALAFLGEAQAGRSAWFLARGDGGTRPTWAGAWYMAVLAVVLLHLMRWVWRLVLWHVFLFRFTRIGIRLYPTHPDRTAGLGFLVRPTFAYAPLTFAMTASLAGVVANRLLFSGYHLSEFAPLGACYAVFVLLLFLLPLIVILAPLLARTRRQALEDWGRLGARHGEDFYRRWGIQTVEESPTGKAPEEEAPSLEELSIAVQAIQAIRPVPFQISDVVGFLLPLAAPAVPLLFLAFPAREVFRKIADLLF